jgi:hypothetical protein
MLSNYGTEIEGELDMLIRNRTSHLSDIFEDHVMPIRDFNIQETLVEEYQRVHTHEKWTADDHFFVYGFLSGIFFDSGTSGAAPRLRGLGRPKRRSSAASAVERAAR